jgi:prepilin-type N-terminal cleavage/methylation domain-containing protein
MNRRGMTLLELVVALAVTGMAMSGGYAAFTTLADRREAAAARSSETLRQATAREQLATWLASARLTISEDEIVFRGIDGATHGDASALADDDIEFFTTAATPVAAAGTIVHLYVDRDEATPERGLVAELREWRGPRAERLVLEPNAAALDGRYLSGLFGQRQWLSSWVSTTVLPAGARLTFSAAPGDSLPPLWQLPVTASIEGGR